MAPQKHPLWHTTRDAACEANTNTACHRNPYGPQLSRHRTDCMGPFNAEGHVGMMIFARSPIGLLQALKGAKRDVSFLGKRKDFSEGRWPHGSGAI